MALADPLAVIIIAAHASKMLELWGQMSVAILNALDCHHCILSLDLNWLGAIKIVEMTFVSELLLRALLLRLTWEKNSVSGRIALVEIKARVVSLVRHCDGSTYFEVDILVGRGKAR